MSPKDFSSYQNPIDLFINLRDGDINTRTVLKNWIKLKSDLGKIKKSKFKIKISNKCYKKCWNFERLKNVDETRNYFLEEIEQNEIMIRKVFTTLNYADHFLILVSKLTGCFLIFDFASLFDVPIGFESSAVGLKICAINAGIKKDKSIFEKKKQRNMIK